MERFLRGLNILKFYFLISMLVKFLRERDREIESETQRQKQRDRDRERYTEWQTGSQYPIPTTPPALDGFHPLEVLPPLICTTDYQSNL